MNIFLAKGATGVRDEGWGVFKAAAVLFRVESARFEGRLPHRNQEIWFRVFYDGKRDVKKIISDVGNGLFHVKKTLHGNEISIFHLKMSHSQMKNTFSFFKKNIFNIEISLFKNEKTDFRIKNKVFHTKNTIFNTGKDVFSMKKGN